MSFSLEEFLAPAPFAGDPDLPLFFHKRPCFFAALGILAGMLVFALCGIRYAYYALAVLVLLLISAIYFKKRFLIFLLVFSVIALTNVCVRCPTEITIKTGTVEGTVAEQPQTEDGKSVFLLRDVRVNGVKIRGKLRVTVYELYGFSYGQTVRASARFSAAGKRERYLLSQQVAADATFTASSVKIISKKTDLYGRLILLRCRIAEQIASLFPGNDVLARGMLLGSAQSGAEADDADIASFQRLGISHLLAISGLHIGVLAGAVIFLVRPIKRFLPKYLILTAFLLFYCAITAFSPSVLRASLMVLIAYPAVPLRKHADTLSALSLAFVILLLLNPFSFWSAGFRLSFLAVYGLVTLAPLLKKGFSVLHRGVRDSLSAGIAVLISTLPAIAESYGSVSVVAVAANLFILPLVPFFLIPAFIVTAISFISYPVAAFLAVVPRIVLKLITWIVSLGGAVDLAVTAPNGFSYVLILAAILFVSPVCVTRSPFIKAIPAAILLAAGIILWIVL